MKRIIFLALMMATAIKLIAQDFASVGATSIVKNFSNSDYNYYIKSLSGRYIILF